MQGIRVVDRADTELQAHGPKVTDGGRAAAFRSLIDTELDRAYRLAAVILADRFEAEDAVHDAAVLAWRRWADLRDPTRFEAWFGRILVNVCRDRLRHRHRRARIELVRGPSDREHPITGDGTVELAERDRIRRSLGQLSADEQLALVLRYEADLSVPAIAERLAVPEGTVKSRLHHALGKLRRALQEADR
jgi:RNA polymerase sigma factor (sigma-70 family)